MIKSYRLVEGDETPDKDTFLAKLDQIRQQGFLREPSPTLDGILNMSFPVLDLNGEAICTLTCPYIRRIDKSDPPGVEQVFAGFQSAAAEIGEQLRG